MVMSRWALAFAGAAVMTAMSAGGEEAGSCSLPTWGAASPVGTEVYGAAVTSAGGFIYSAGGYSFGGVVNQFRRYDPVANAWTTLASVPTPVYVASLAYDAVGGRLFLFGGGDSFGNPNNLAQVYNIGANIWSAGPPLPAPRQFMGSGVIGGFMYLVGGQSTSSPSSAESQNWQFNPATGGYLPRATLPSAVGGPGSAVSAGRLYIMGGRNSAGATIATNYEYDAAANTWATKAPVPTAVNVPGSTALSAMAPCNGDIILVGGGNPFLAAEALPRSPRVVETTNISQLYDVATNAWTNGPALPVARSFIGVAQAGSTLLSLGGFNGSAPVATVDRIEGPPLPVRLHGFGVE
jgi:hypothetical protein